VASTHAELLQEAPRLTSVQVGKHPGSVTATTNVQALVRAGLIAGCQISQPQEPQAQPQHQLHMCRVSGIAATMRIGVLAIQATGLVSVTLTCTDFRGSANHYSKLTVIAARVVGIATGMYSTSEFESGQVAIISHIALHR